MLTLQELKRIVKAPGCGEKTPTVKELCSAGVAAAEKILNGNAEITVYKNGYAVYRAGECTTVFSIYSCGGYSYGPDGSGHIEEQFFEQEAWYTRLVLEGEDRLERNREARKRGLEVSYSAVSEELDLCQYFGQKKLKDYAVFSSSSSSFCWGVM